MADIKKGSDLITTMGETEKRLKKLERQLAVARKGDSSIVTEEANTSVSTVQYFGDSVKVVATANCLIHCFVQVDAKQSAGNGVVYITDVTDNLFVYQLLVTDTFYRTHSSAPGALAAAANHDYPDWVIGVGVGPGFITLPYTTAGPREFKLGFSTSNSVGSLTFKNRKLFAWVQPF